jgi:hypothetical protein
MDGDRKALHRQDDVDDLVVAALELGGGGQPEHARVTARTPAGYR